MSWNDGSGLFGEMAYIVRKSVPDLDARREIYEHMIDAFVEVGWDGHFDDLKGLDPVLDEVCDERDPDSEVEEDEDDFIEDED